MRATKANVRETEDTRALFWTAGNANQKETTVWYIDSGASQRMSRRKDLMENYREFPVPKKARLCNNRIVKAHGKGSIWPQVEATELSEVLYVSDLAKNLFSVSAAAKRGLTVAFMENKSHMMNDKF